MTTTEINLKLAENFEKVITAYLQSDPNMPLESVNKAVSRILKGTALSPKTTLNLCNFFFESTNKQKTLLVNQAKSAKESDTISQRFDLATHQIIKTILKVLSLDGNHQSALGTLEKILNSSFHAFGQTHYLLEKAAKAKNQKINRSLASSNRICELSIKLLINKRCNLLVQDYILNIIIPLALSNIEISQFTKEAMYKVISPKGISKRKSFKPTNSFITTQTAQQKLFGVTNTKLPLRERVGNGKTPISVKDFKPSLQSIKPTTHEVRSTQKATQAHFV